MSGNDQSEAREVSGLCHEDKTFRVSSNSNNLPARGLEYKSIGKSLTEKGNESSFFDPGKSKKMLAKSVT